MDVLLSYVFFIIVLLVVRIALTRANYCIIIDVLLLYYCFSIAVLLHFYCCIIRVLLLYC